MKRRGFYLSCQVRWIRSISGTLGDGAEFSKWKGRQEKKRRAPPASPWFPQTSSFCPHPVSLQTRDSSELECHREPGRCCERRRPARHKTVDYFCPVAPVAPVAPVDRHTRAWRARKTGSFSLVSASCRHLMRKLRAAISPRFFPSKKLHVQICLRILLTVRC